MNNFNNKIINGNSLDVLKKIPENSVDLVVTSPPYNVGIEYDSWFDKMPIEEYWDFTKEWLTGVYNVLKDDGRIAVNIPYDLNIKERDGRLFFSAEIYNIMKNIGFNFFGVVDLEEETPHRSIKTAWGSWMSASSPYIYNPKECVILAYKNISKKLKKGESQWTPIDILMVEKEDGSGKKRKVVFSDDDKKEFMSLVYAKWEYKSEKNPLTKACFSSDIPDKAIKILTYKDDVVLDPFSGSGTTAISCIKLNRKYIGIEISKKYYDISIDRINNYKVN